MVAAGMLLGWAGYALALWGWCLIRDYDVPFGQLVSPAHPYGSGKGQPWPPAKLPATVTWPGQKPAPPDRTQPGGTALAPQQVAM